MQEVNQNNTDYTNNIAQFRTRLLQQVRLIVLFICSDTRNLEILDKHWH